MKKAIYLDESEVKALQMILLVVLESFTHGVLGKIGKDKVTGLLEKVNKLSNAGGEDADT